LLYNVYMGNIIKKTNEILGREIFGVLLFQFVGMLMSFAYAVFNGALGLTQKSYWYFTMGGYFLALSDVKGEAFFLRRNGEERFGSASLKRSGIMMILLAVTVSGIIVLEICEKRNPVKDMRIMIAIAAYTFVTLAVAVAGHFRAKRGGTVSDILLRSASLAAAIGSMLSLERGMLGTFGDPADSFTLVMEAATGMAAFLSILALGLYLVHHGKRQIKTKE